SSQTPEDGGREVGSFSLVRALEMRGITPQDLDISQNESLQDILTAYGEMKWIDEDPALFKRIQTYLRRGVNASEEDEVVSPEEILHHEAFVRLRVYKGDKKEDLGNFSDMLDEYNPDLFSDEVGERR